MSEKLSDILPPADGWVGAIIPLDLKPHEPIDMAVLFDALEGEEETLIIGGFYDDVGGGEHPSERN